MSCLSLPLIDQSAPAPAASPLVGISDPAPPNAAWFEPILELFTATLRLTGQGGAQGLFASEGDSLHNADALRLARDVDGTGVRIGVLSSGGEGLTQAQFTGDLPATIDVHAPAGHAGGRGTAMLEVIHDLAPGAELSLATAHSKASLLGASAAGPVGD
jgi:hypothetical protein